MRRLALTTDGWSHEPVLLATTPFRRWRGLRGAGPGVALLIETSSVHAFGMDRSFRAVALSPGLEVMETTMMAPGQVARFRGCRFVIELPGDVEPPPRGSVLEIRDV